MTKTWLYSEVGVVNHIWHVLNFNRVQQFYKSVEEIAEGTTISVTNFEYRQ